MQFKTIFTLILMSTSISSLAQFGADYSSYGFNFVNDTDNNGFDGWQSTNIANTAKLNIYKQSTVNNYALELKSQNDVVKMTYDDSGYMDLNPCGFVINLRINIPLFTGNQDEFTFKLYTGSKEINFQIRNTGIYYLDNTNSYAYITAAPAANQWFTYTISLDDCASNGELMIENDNSNLFSLSLPTNAASQSIELATTTNGATVFETEVDHLMIYSNPIKWWLGPATPYVNETNYAGTTGDRQHYLSLPNGERMGINENGGGYVTFTELTAGGANLDPNPKFGSGGTKTLRGYFHSKDYNPVQPGASSTTGGHLVTVNSSADELEIEPFPLHLYYSSGVTENNPLVFPSGETMTNTDNTTVDGDVYDEFGLDMRHEIITEMDFSSTLKDVSQTGGISVVRHRAEWEFIRHPCQLLQYHEPDANPRFQLKGSDAPHSDSDMGEMRHKFEIRFNKDLGYKWVLWRENGAWQTLELTAIGQKQSYVSFTASTVPMENRFMIFSTSNSLTDPNAVAFYYPESTYNANCTVQKSRTDKSVQSQDDRRFKFNMIADWRKTNWCRINMYIFNRGLYAPNHDDVNTYETFQMEAYQLFGTPTQVWTEIQGISLPIELTAFEAQLTTEQQVSLSWQTATETNNNFFTVERSKNGTAWETLQTIDGAGNSTEPIDYATIDEKPLLGVSFYRLKQTDFDGKFSYFDIQSISIEGEKQYNIKVFPNPSSDMINVDLNGISLDNLQLVDNTGQDVTSKIHIISENGQQLTIDISRLSVGNYYLIINHSITNKIQKGR
jgi:hypothetical protein